MVAHYEAREPVTTRTHDRPWAADLETDAHAADRSLVVAEAVDAVEATERGFVDLVTPEPHGDPETYLYPALRARPEVVGCDDEGRCSCGGYVTRVRVEPETE